MGFYLRKSISVGPLRFNLSKSGIGVSAGIKGFRVGMGPRGNYVHMGRGGIYYRATIPTGRSNSQSPSVTEPEQFPQIPVETHTPLVEIESAHVSQLIDTSSQELLGELNHKRSKMISWPLVTGTALFLIMLANDANWPTWAMTLLIVTGALGIWAAYTWDSLRKTVVLFYNFDDEMEAAYAALHEAATELTKCAKVWHIEAEGRVLDRKYHAGASSLIRRKGTSINKSPPPFVKTNIETVAIGVGKQTLYFFPDRILIYEKNGIGIVSYKDLQIQVQQTSFVESETVPRDAKVIDRTWRYVNKSGGPDRRFKDNPEIPICLYEELHFSSNTGLNEVIHVSRCNNGDALAKSITTLAQQLSGEMQAI